MSNFGRHLLSEFYLDPDAVYLNHGTVGVTPRRVLAEQQRLQIEMERHPSRFVLREYSGLSGKSDLPQSRVRAAADCVGDFVRARGEDVVFVENATAGNMAVISSIPLKAGDEIVISDHEYGSTALIAKFVAQQCGATVVTAALPYPRITPELVYQTIIASLNDRTRLLVINHHTSESALRLPIERIAAVCKQRGIYIHIDAAHAYGLLDLDIPKLSVDSYTTNIHKWGFAPKGTAMLWVKPEHQSKIHPAVISWGLNAGFTKEFDWIGTRDVTGWLSAPAAIAFMKELGPAEMRKYTYDLAWQGAMHLCEIFTTTMEVPREMCTAMLTIPLPSSIPPNFDAVSALRYKLLYDHQIEVQMNPFAGRVWMRLSAQIYDDLSDFERLGRTLKSLL